MRRAAGPSGAARELEGDERDERRPGNEDDPEPRSVGDAVRARLAVLDERRPGKGPGSHAGSGDRRGDGEQRPLDPVAPEPEPQAHAEHRCGDPGP